MSELFLLYLIAPAAVLILYIRAKDLELPPGVTETGISRAYLKISLLIYNRIRKKVRTLSGEKIRMYLGTLEQRKDLDNAECEYFIRKISIVLVMITAGSVLALLMSLSANNSGVIQDGGIIERGAFGEDEFDARLTASDGEGEEIFNYTLPVRIRVFTKEETRKLFDEAAGILEQTILGDNESLDCVTKDLDLVTKLSGYPFDIAWQIDNYDVMHLDGKLVEDEIPEEGVVVNLTAVYSYEDEKFEQLFCANVVPRQLSESERVFRNIKKLLEKADEDSLTEKTIALPEEYDGRELVWSERPEDNSLFLLMLVIVGAALSFVLKDKELKKEIDRRRDEMLFDYPQFVSHLVLYMGAGMTVRNILGRLSKSYSAKLDLGEKKRFLSEEILRATRQMAAGTSESAVYEQLGLRCGMQQYTRLFTLLSQNLRKGNSELFTLLQEESKKAFEERMDKVRKAGEEAGTRLLLPMVIMLLIVMVVIMIPAYMAF